MDVLTKEQRTKNMKAIRSTNTKMEVALCKALFAMGHRYRKNDKRVLGKPDLTFKNLKIAVFIDSEFFHGKDWNINKYRIKSNRMFWWNKIESNIRRDIQVNEQLERDGWKILRFWSSDISKNLQTCALIIDKEIQQKRNDSKIFRHQKKTSN